MEQPDKTNRYEMKNEGHAFIGKTISLMLTKPIKKPTMLERLLSLLE